MARQLDCATAHGACSPLHQDGASVHGATDMDSAMCRDAGYPEASALVHRHVLGQGGDLIHGDHRELRRGTKRTVRLGSIAPHRPTDPGGRNAVTDLVHRPGTVAVRNDARIGHAVAERVLALPDVA